MGLRIWIQLEEHNLRHRKMCWCLEFLGSIRIINVRYLRLFPTLNRYDFTVSTLSVFHR